MDREALLLRLIRHEGLRLRPYRDSVGKLTIGIGRNLDDVGVTHAEAKALCLNDIDRVCLDLDRNIPWWGGLSETRRQVVAEMAFNLGWPRLSLFRAMLTALQFGDTERAALEMTDSLWARQVGARAETLAAAMRSGRFTGRPFTERGE